MNYEDKLRLAKEALASGSYDKETIEYIFPELRESEDEKIIKALLEYFSYYNSGSAITNDVVVEDVLAWLEKQSKQKSVEWSRKDEKHIESIIACLKEFLSPGFPIYKGGVVDEKSLKPNHWKPSEGQMKALETTIHISNFGLDINRLRMLESLYNNLKNL